jgi:hypothetical protein
MKKYNRFLFLVLLVMAFPSFVAVIPAFSGLLADIYAVQPIDGIPAFFPGSQPDSANFDLPSTCTPS